MPPQAQRGSGARSNSIHGHGDERFQQLLARMRAALQLGLRPSSLRKEGGLRWGNTDAQVQGQAVRAIAAFVAAIPPRPFPLASLQGAIEEAAAALEYLLSVEQETIYKQAAGASAGLARATQGRYMLRLLSPLACLLAPSKTPQAAASAAVAMQSILAMVRPQITNGGTVGDDRVWETLHEADTLKYILWRLDNKQNNNETVGVAECAEVLAMIMERWPAARYRVGRVEAVRSSLLVHCMSSSEVVVIAGLRACQALGSVRAVLCAGIAALQLQSGEPLWATLAHCLHESQPLLVNREALRLLSLLGRLSSFTASFNGPHMRAIIKGCLRNIEGNKMRSSVVEKGVMVEAAHATSVLLGRVGDHHGVFLELGIVRVLFTLFSEKDTFTNTKSAEDSPGKLDGERKSRGTGKVTALLWPLLWEIVGCLAAHLRSPPEKATLTVNLSKASILGGLPVHACATLLQALHKNGHGSSRTGSEPSPETSGTADEAQMSSQELLQLCKAVFLLLSSPSQVLSASTRLSLENLLDLHGHSWLTRLADSLALGHTGPSLVKPDNVQTATNLFALACFSHLPLCQEFLLQGKAVEVVMAIINIHAKSAVAQKQGRHGHRTKWSVSHARAGRAVKTCCEEISEDWEGVDTVLFASVCTFAKLVQGSAWARVVASTLGKGRLDEASCSEGSHGAVVSLLWKLAESTTVAAGVRWWAVCGLACFDVYGFPSAVGRDICQAFDDSFLADIQFVLGDGSRLLAHGIILAVRCPSLLPKSFAFGERKSVEDTVCNEIHLSDRISYQALKSVLEFIYSGVVHIDSDEVADVRVLAKRCGLEPLTSLLHGGVPEWGLPPAPCDLASALEIAGYPFTDITLRGKQHVDASGESRSPCGEGEGCWETWTHAHAHRVVLSSRCEYFQALFRSGMRDSTVEVIDIHMSTDSLRTLLYFWYTGKLLRLMQAKGWCAWNNLDIHDQIRYLQGLVELAQLAGQWLITDFQEECYLLVMQHLEACNLHLGPPVITHAATCEQWDLVEMCANHIAPVYKHLRDTGAFENLDEGLKEVLRTAHVQLALSDFQLDAG